MYTVSDCGKFLVPRRMRASPFFGASASHQSPKGLLKPLEWDPVLVHLRARRSVLWDIPWGRRYVYDILESLYEHDATMCMYSPFLLLVLHFLWDSPVSIENGCISNLSLLQLFLEKFWQTSLYRLFSIH